MKDTYETLATEAEGFFKDRGSKFHAYAFSVLSTEDVQQRLEQVRKLHPKARHHCYAYRIGLDQYNFRANDDGEPSGTAGKPILGQIDSFGLTNVLIVVVRYFGGTLLGASGLINAYKKSAADALKDATVKTVIVEDFFTLRFDYQHLSNIMNTVSKPPFRIVEQRFHLEPELDIAIQKSLQHDALRKLKAVIAQVYLEEVDELESIPGFEIIVLS